MCVCVYVQLSCKALVRAHKSYSLRGKKISKVVNMINIILQEEEVKICEGKTLKNLTDTLILKEEQNDLSSKKVS